MPLNKALGEFAHTMPTSKWAGARELLAKFQTDVDPDRAIFVARGASLDFVAQLAAAEIHDSLLDLSPAVAGGVATLFERYGLDATMDPATVEQKFTHIWNLRR
jgi:hypothetical protein